MGRSGSDTLTTIGSLVGIVAGVLSIVGFFASSGQSVVGGLGEVLNSPFLSSLAGNLNDFAASWALGPILTGVVIYLIVVVLRIAGEVIFDLFTMGISVSSVIRTALFFLPLAAAWVFVFSGRVSTFGTILFVGGYFVSVASSLGIAELLT